MSGSHSRTKGQRGEREIVAFLHRMGYDAARGWQARQGHAQCDVEGTEWWVEVKRGKRVNVRQAMRQAMGDRDKRRPMVVWRDDREPWMVSVHLEDAVRLFMGDDDGAARADADARGPGAVVDDWGRVARCAGDQQRSGEHAADVGRDGQERDGAD